MNHSPRSSPVSSHRVLDERDLYMLDLLTSQRLDPLAIAVRLNLTLRSVHERALAIMRADSLHDPEAALYWKKAST